MQQVKIFQAAENETEQLEQSINLWLRETEVQIISITGNIAPQSASSSPRARPAPSDILLIVLYETLEA